MNATTVNPRAVWDEAHRSYLDKRAEYEAIPLGTAGEDEAVNVWMEAMDHLIEKVPAPDGEALAIKIELAATRDIPMYDQWIAAFAADARRLTMKDK